MKDIELGYQEEKYNQLLQRHEKAAIYLDNPTIAIEEKEKYIPVYLAILKELSKILEQINQNGGLKV
jgi:hypothetical protein